MKKNNELVIVDYTNIFKVWIWNDLHPTAIINMSLLSSWIVEVVSQKQKVAPDESRGAQLKLQTFS